MAKWKLRNPGKGRKRRARTTAAGLMAASLAATVASPAAAEAYITMLQGQRMEFKWEDYSSIDVSLFEQIIYDPDYFAVDESDPFTLKAVTPTAGSSTLVTLQAMDLQNMTVTEAVYVDIVENTPPYHKYDHEDRVLLRPGEIYEFWLYVDDEDLSAFPNIENVTIYLDGIPEFIDYALYGAAGWSLWAEFSVAETAQPGTYPATVTATDIAGNSIVTEFLIQVDPLFAPMNPYFFMERVVNEPVPLDLLYMMFLEYSEEMFEEPGNASFYGDTLIVEHPYGNVVQFSDNPSSGGLTFTEAGTYDVQIYSCEYYQDVCSQPVHARFQVDDHYFSIVNPLFAMFGISPSGPFILNGDTLIVEGTQEGDAYLIPHETDFVPTVEELELRVANGSGRKFPLEPSGSAYSRMITIEPFDPESERYSLYIARDGEIQYARHFLIVGTEGAITIEDILKYYETPFYPAEDAFMTQLMFQHITPLVWGDMLIDDEP